MSGACGAVLAAYSQCLSGETIPFDMDDMQQSWLRDAIGPYCKECSEQEDPYVIYARSVPRKPVGLIVKKRRAPAAPGRALVLVRPVTRSQAPRPRMRVQTDRLKY